MVGVASAMLDVSDGLHDDACKLMHASGCGADLDAAQIPLSTALLRFAGETPARELALTGGDDYELLFTVPPGRERRFSRITGRWSCAVTCLGTLTARRGVRWWQDGVRFAFRDRTFRHFR